MCFLNTTGKLFHELNCVRWTGMSEVQSSDLRWRWALCPVLRACFPVASQLLYARQAVKQANLRRETQWHYPVMDASILIWHPDVTSCCSVRRLLVLCFALNKHIYFQSYWDSRPNVVKMEICFIRGYYFWDRTSHVGWYWRRFGDSYCLRIFVLLGYWTMLCNCIHHWVRFLGTESNLGPLEKITINLYTVTLCSNMVPGYL
jgi:hypothetical protein